MEDKSYCVVCKKSVDDDKFNFRLDPKHQTNKNINFVICCNCILGFKGDRD